MEYKRITKYLEYAFCVLVPVYYECEKKAAWRIVFIGTKEECEKAFFDYPDHLKASEEENKENRKYRFQEYLYLEKCGKHKEAEKIKKAFCFGGVTI